MNASTLETERVRRHTSPAVNAKIDHQIAAIVRQYAGESATVISRRIEEIEDPMMREFRYLDKLIDELAKGRPMEKILRQA